MLAPRRGTRPSGGRRTKANCEMALYSPCSLFKSECALYDLHNQKTEARLATRGTGREKMVLNKTAAVCIFCDMGRGGKGRRPDASCESGQALEKAQNGNGQLLEKVGMDLGLAPRPLGFGATSVWGWRCAGLGSRGMLSGQCEAPGPRFGAGKAPGRRLEHGRG